VFLFPDVAVKLDSRKVWGQRSAPNLMNRERASLCFALPNLNVKQLNAEKPKETNRIVHGGKAPVLLGVILVVGRECSRQRASGSGGHQTAGAHPDPDTM
jgi:hypothetical protein